MAEAKFDLSKVSFEDVIDGTTAPTPKSEDVKIPEKEDDVPIPPKKEEVENTEDNDNQEASFYESLNKLIGYEVEGEFDESVEGVAEYAKAIGQRMAEEEVRDLFESFPDVKEYLQFRLNNGDPAKYFETKYGEDYSKYAVTEEDVTTQETIVRKYLVNDGYKEDQINEIIKDYKDTGLLYKQAKRLAEKLTESQKYKKEELLVKQAEEARLAEEKRQEMVSEINSTIDKGTLHNIVIPEKDRKDFKAWLLQPDQRGQTKRQATMSQMSIQQKLELEYLAFKGFDLKDLVRKEAANTKIEFLKKGAASKGSRLFGTGVEKNPKGGLQDKLKDVKLSNLI